MCPYFQNFVFERGRWAYVRFALRGREGVSIRRVPQRCRPAKLAVARGAVVAAARVRRAVQQALRVRFARALAKLALLDLCARW